MLFKVTIRWSGDWYQTRGSCTGAAGDSPARWRMVKYGAEISLWNQDCHWGKVYSNILNSLM